MNTSNQTKMRNLHIFQDTRLILLCATYMHPECNNNMNYLLQNLQPMVPLEIYKLIKLHQQDKNVY